MNLYLNAKDTEIIIHILEKITLNKKLNKKEIEIINSFKWEMLYRLVDRK